LKLSVAGECDALPEQAFYMVGAIEEAFEKAKTLQERLPHPLLPQGGVPAKRAGWSECTEICQTRSTSTSSAPKRAATRARPSSSCSPAKRASSASTPSTRRSSRASSPDR